MNTIEAASLPKQVADIRSAFATIFNDGSAVQTISPGRVNIIGEHVDHQLYPVFPCCISQTVSVAVGISKTSDSVLSLRHVNHAEKNAFLPADYATWGDVKIDDTNRKTWHSYVLGSLMGVVGYLVSGSVDEVRTSIHPDLGLNSPAIVASGILDKLPRIRLLLDGHIPIAAGVSSSAAVIVGCTAALFGLLASEMNRKDLFQLPRSSIAALGVHAEHFVGTQCGGMDQAVIALSRPGSALSIKFAPLEVTAVKLPPHVSLVVLNTCRSAAKAEALPFQYNKRVFELRCAAYILLVSTFEEKNEPPPEALNDNDFMPQLRTVEHMLRLSSLSECIEKVEQNLRIPYYTKSDILRIIPKGKIDYLLGMVGQDVWDLNEEFYLKQRARHVFAEALRVEQMQVLLDNENIPETEKHRRMGELMNESHYSLRDDFDCSCDELNRAADLARSLGAHGSRLTGAGWGGCCLSLVDSKKVKHFMQEMVSGYFAPTYIEQERAISAGEEPRTCVRGSSKDTSTWNPSHFVDQLFEVIPGHGMRAFLSRESGDYETHFQHK